MKQTTAELTNKYINNHPHIKNCLKRGLINYSALARHIAKELGIEKQSSKEAILMAASRIHDKLKKELAREKDITTLLSKSEIEIKNKIIVFVIEKNIDYDLFQTIQTKSKRNCHYWNNLHGSAWDHPRNHHSWRCFDGRKF